MTLAQYAERWLRMASAHVKPRTVKSYSDMLRLYILPRFGATRVRDLQRNALRTFLTDQLASHAKNTVRLMHATMRTMLAVAVDDGLIVANPADKLGRSLRLVEKAKVLQEQVKAFDRAQRDTFLAAAYRLVPQYAPMWEVQTLAGLRPGEIYALQEDDLDLDAGTARIARTLADDGKSVDTPKGNRARTIDLSTRAVQVLRAHLTARKAMKLKHRWLEMPSPLFCETDGTYPDPRYVRKLFTKIVKATKLPHITPHGLRHTYASLALVARVDVYYVSRMLGHASISETVDTYGRWLPANRKGALDVLDGPAHQPAVTTL